MPFRKLRARFFLGALLFTALFAFFQNMLWKESSPPNLIISKEAPHHNSIDSVKAVNSNVVNYIPQQQPSESKDKKNISLSQRAIEMNFAQKLHHVDKFGQHTKDSTILVVQVHDRVMYFKEFLNSLKVVAGINNATLVISMDKFTTEIDQLVSGIDFCRYMTIFFPFAMQLYPNSFPGEDPNDCPRDIEKERALAMKCNNAEHPDMFGHYREVKYVQIKHHWFWKLHMVFSGTRAFVGHQAPVILLEEDYFLVPDVLHVSKLAVELKNARCSRCSLISLGNYDLRQDYALGNQVEIHSWASSKANMGMVITREFYDIISDITNEICEYDDYNWDWSLQAAMKKSSPDKLFTLQIKATRIFHLGSCGGMHTKKTCDLGGELKGINTKLHQNTDRLFPNSLHVASDNPAGAPMPRANGGWGDVRDHHLCKRYKSLCQSLLS